MKGVSTLSIIPVRKEPSDRSEMVTQILFGETFKIISAEKSWCQVQLDYDGYTGWIDSRQITNLDEEDSQKLESSPVSVSLDLIQLVLRDKEMIPVVLGSTLPFYYGKKFFVNDLEYAYDGSVKTITGPESAKVVENAFMFMNAPYLWGGRSPFGIDCSGFTQMVFKLSGVKLLRDAYQQAGQGKRIQFEDATEGDLAFFRNEEKRIVHVGIILGGMRIIHSSGKVRIDKLDEEGIFNAEAGRHTHFLAEIRRVTA